MYWSLNHGVVYIAGIASGSLNAGESSLDLLYNHIERAYGLEFSQGHGGDRRVQNKKGIFNSHQRCETSAEIPIDVHSEKALALCEISTEYK